MSVFLLHKVFELYRSHFEIEIFLGIVVLRVVLLFLLVQVILPFHCWDEIGEDGEM